MSIFTATNGEVDAALLEAETLEAIEAAFEGWEPAEGQIEVWLTKAFSRIGANVFDQATVMEKGAFKRFGESIVNVPPIQAAPATVESVWTMVDEEGYEIPAGTQVSIETSGGITVGFETVADTVIAPGFTTAEILLAAIEPGTEGNGLSKDPQPVDAVSFVESIVLEGVTSGGIDEEDEDTYLDRLVQELQLLSLSLVIERDFEIDARSVPGIARAKCIGAWDAEAEEEKVLAVSVFPIDVNGEALTKPVKDELKERQEGKLPANTLLFIADPDYTSIDVKTKVVVEEGFDPATVIAAVKARLNSYLSPATWGIPGTGDASSSTGWINRTTVYRFELVSEVDRVVGVDRVVSLELAKDETALETKDVVLTGVAPLTKPADIEVTA